MKAEPSWLIPLKPIKNVELFIVNEGGYWNLRTGGKLSESGPKHRLKLACISFISIT